MATLQLRNIPDSVVIELRDRARHFHRELEDEATAMLTQAITNDMWRRELTAQELVERARKVREGHPHAFMTEEFLRMAKEDGRA